MDWKERERDSFDRDRAVSGCSSISNVRYRNGPSINDRSGVSVYRRRIDTRFPTFTVILGVFEILETAFSDCRLRFFQIILAYLLTLYVGSEWQVYFLALPPAHYRYRVTHLVDSNFLLTSEQKFHFGQGRADQANTEILF